MNSFVTKQEKAWGGTFGDQYVGRNAAAELIPPLYAFFSKVLCHAPGVSSIVELGANIGLNLQALHAIIPAAELEAIEINATACTILRQLEAVNKVHEASLLEFNPDRQYDLALIRGVLIHIHPESVALIYKLLYNISSRYICIAEYYNPKPIEVPYRGEKGLLYKRDFAGELLDMFPDVRLVDYGFIYHRDPVFPQDDITWFLLEKARP